MEIQKRLDSQNKSASEEKVCFIIMPISDMPGYDEGHFTRVYNYLIKPAVENAGFEAVRADEVNKTNYIIVDILRQIVTADIALCDLSSRNPNVLYELGIRQAFNLPVTLIKDVVTPKIFDIQGLRYIDYDENLRIDNITKKVEQISDALKKTFESRSEDVNSVIQLLEIAPAELKRRELSADTSLLLESINNISSRISSLENLFMPALYDIGNSFTVQAKRHTGSKNNFNEHDRVYHKRFGEGIVLEVQNDGGLVVRFKEDLRFIVPPYEGMKKLSNKSA